MPARRASPWTTQLLTGLTDGAAGPELEKAPTGIRGLDQITGGGLPRGRVTLVAGSAGAGKTLLGLEFLVAGARKYGEPGVLVTFEESAAKVTATCARSASTWTQLQRDGLLVVLSFRVDPAEIVATGEFDFEPLFLHPRRRDQAGWRQAGRAGHHRGAVRRVRRRLDRAGGTQPAGALARGPGRHRHRDRGAGRQESHPRTGSRSTSPTA